MHTQNTAALWREMDGLAGELLRSQHAAPNDHAGRALFWMRGEKLRAELRAVEV